MRRRTFLSSTAGASLLVATSGCLGSLTLPDSAYEVSSPKYWDETGQTGDDRPISFSATVLGGEYDGDTAPVTVQITMTNTADQTWYFRSQDPMGLFGSTSSEDERHRLIHPGRGDELGQTFTGECWQTETYSGIPAEIPPTHGLHAGGWRAQVLEIVLKPGQTCPSTPPAAFEFSTGYVVYRDEETDAQLASGKWKFSITNE